MFKSLFPCICSTALPQSKQFYESLFGMKPAFEIDWYVQLHAEHNESIQIAFVEKNHSSVPAGFKNDPKGVVVTFDFDEVDDIYERARDLELPIVLELRNEEYGQRHFMTKDPNGLLIDVVKLIEPSEEFVKQYL